MDPVQLRWLAYDILPYDETGERFTGRCPVAEASLNPFYWRVDGPAYTLCSAGQVLGSGSCLRL